VEEIRSEPACGLVREGDALAVVEPIPDRRVRLDDEAEGEDRLLRIPSTVEADVIGVLGVPEVLLGARDDLLEVRRAPAVAGGLEHRREVLGRDGLVGGVERHGRTLLGMRVSHY